jgi:pimeloyl-ACP methyl ester carboxylesterase
MLRVAKGAVLATAAAFALVLVTAAAALATPPTTVVFTPCTDTPGFGCATLTVPLDPTGVVPGTVTLAIERKVAVTGTATQAVIGLAGGPGQAAIPLATFMGEAIAPALATRDLVVFDQRGTGTSGPLSCPAFEDPDANLTTALLVTCATQLGVQRGFYESDNSVADIEAIRRALGYSQVVLYGTSYGTKVALRYAEQYPANVAGLVLDSTVPPDGPDVFSEATFAAVPRVLGELCAKRACARITPSPVSDLTKVVTRLNVHPAHTTVINDRGHPTRIAIAADDVLNVVIAGDLDPPLRAGLPAALHDAAHGDFALLGELVVEANAPEGGINDELYFATSCEENAFPWDRSDTPTQRTAQAIAAFQALPPLTFAPFSAQTAYDFSNAAYCADWPFETAAPESTTGVLPNVPTLILSGDEDTRTPTADADAVAAQIPDATVLVVPNTGHSVLGSDPTPCSENAVKAFFAGTAVMPCPATSIPSYLRPVPLPPRSVAVLHAATHTSGLPGRTVTAVLDTLSEALDRSIEELLASSSLSATVRFGGLRAGSARFSFKGLKLHHYSYVPGVVLTGTFGGLKNARSTLQISGSHAATGELILNTKNHTVTGTLGGVSIDVKSKTLGRAAAASVNRAAFAARVPSN